MRKGQKKGTAATSTGIEYLYSRKRGKSLRFFIRVAGREKYLKARDLKAAKFEMPLAILELRAHATGGPITADELYHKRIEGAWSQYEQIIKQPLTLPDTLRAFLPALKNYPEFSRDAAIETLKKLGRDRSEENIALLCDEIVLGIETAAVAWEHRVSPPPLPPRPGSPEALEAHVEDWLATLNTEATSKAMARRTIAKLAKELPRIADVSPEKVQTYVNRLAKNNLSPSTIRRQLSELRGYWKYLAGLGLAPKNIWPFNNLALPRAPKGGNGESIRKPFDPADVMRLLHAAKNRKTYRDLANLIRLAMWTGCRREELCSLKVGDVKDTYFTVRDAKSKAGLREIPIHSQLKQTLHRLIEGRPDNAYVLRDLRTTKYGDRGDAIGKRFTRLKRELGFGEQHVFHSIRKTVATMFEQAGVPENIAADILGHEKPRITYGLYSGGASMDQKREAIEKLAYPMDAGA